MPSCTYHVNGQRWQRVSIVHFGILTRIHDLLWSDSAAHTAQKTVSLEAHELWGEIMSHSPNYLTSQKINNQINDNI